MCFSDISRVVLRKFKMNLWNLWLHRLNASSHTNLPHFISWSEYSLTWTHNKRPPVVGKRQSQHRLTWFPIRYANRLCVRFWTELESPVVWSCKTDLLYNRPGSNIFGGGWIYADSAFSGDGLKGFSGGWLKGLFLMTLESSSPTSSVRIYETSCESCLYTVS